MLLPGGWEQDKRVGYGRYYYYNGDIYDGPWQNHVRHGHGTYTYGDSGVQWTGTWNNGIRVVDSSAPSAPDEHLVSIFVPLYTAAASASIIITVVINVYKRFFYFSNVFLFLKKTLNSQCENDSNLVHICTKTFCT